MVVVPAMPVVYVAHNPSHVNIIYYYIYMNSNLAI